MIIINSSNRNKISFLNNLRNREISISDSLKNKNIKNGKTSFIDRLNEKFANNEYNKVLNQVLDNAKSEGHEISFDNYRHNPQPENKKPLIRSKNQDAAIEELLDYLTERNKEIHSNQENKINICPGNCSNKYHKKLILPDIDKLTFNKDAESIFNLTHITWDIETNSQQRLSAIGTTNYEAKRIVIAGFDEDNPISHSHKIESKDNWYIWFIEVQNPLSALLLADIETVLSATIISALQQNATELIEVAKYQLKDYPLPLNIKLFEETINNLRKSMFIAHNSKFDLNQVIYFNKDNDELDFLNTPKREMVTIRYGKVEDEHEQYAKKFKAPLGNITAGFRVKLIHTTRFNSFWGQPKIYIFLSQQGSKTLTYASDTILIADCVQRTKSYEFCIICNEPIEKCDHNAETRRSGALSLDSLSYGLPYRKYHYETDKIFSTSAFQSWTEESHYLILDCLSTLNVYSDLTYDFVFTKMAERFKIKIPLEETPFVSKLSSNATIAKHITKYRLETMTGLDSYTIEQNIKNQASYLEYFTSLNTQKITYDDKKEKYEFTNETTTHIYSGGKTETQVHGVVRTDPNNIDDVIVGYDFKSQYPLNARLCNAQDQLLEASKNQLHKKQVFGRISGTNYQKKNLKFLMQKIEETIQHLWDCVNSGEAIDEQIFIWLNGVIRYHTNNHQVYLREKPVSKKKNSFERNLDKYIKGTISQHLGDFAYTIMELAFRKGWTIKTSIKALTITEINFLKFDKVHEYGNEMFTEYIVIRDEYPKSDSMNKNLKINANASYGTHAEGISDEKYQGKYYLPSIPSGITAFARLCTNMAELRANILSKLHNIIIEILTGDTDSLFLRGKKQILELIPSIFVNIDPLQFENEKGFNSAIWVLGRKKYAMIGKNAVFDEKTKTYIPGTQENFIQKTHGSGSYGWRTNDVYEEIHRDVLGGIDIQEAINRNLNLFPLNYQLSVKERSSIVKSMVNLKSFDIPISTVTLSNGVDLFIYKDSPIYYASNHKDDTEEQREKKNKSRKDSKKTLLLTTNNDNLIKGQFCDYMNVKLNIKTKRTVYVNENKKARKMNKFYELLIEFNQLGFDWEAFDKPEKKHFIKLFNSTLNNNITRKTSETDMDNYINDYMNDYGHYIREQMNINNGLMSIFEKEEKIRENKKKLRYNKVIIANFSMTDIQLIIDEVYPILNETEKYIFRNMVENRELGREHLEKRFLVRPNQIEKRYYREVDPNHPYKLKIRKGYVRSDPPLPITVDSQKFDTDGFVLTDYVKLIDFGFSSKMKSEINKYYSQAIINTFSLNASINYARTHDIDYTDYFDMKKENLPCPKQRTKSEIRLKLRIIPRIENNEISKEELEFNQIMVNKKSFVNYLLDKTIIRKILGVDTHYEVLRHDRLEELIYKHVTANEFTQIDMLNKTWSIEIVSRKNINYNAKLSVNVVVGRNKMFFASLHINPASNKMINFKTFKIERDKLREESHIIKELLSKFMSKTDYLHGFNRVQQVSQKGMKEEDYLELSYLTLATMAIKNKIQTSNTSLSEFHITTDLKTKYADIVVLMFEHMTNIHFTEIYLAQDPKNEINLRNSFNFKKSSQNSGVALVNFANSSAGIVYSKGYNQTANKIKRVMNKNNIGTKELNYLRNNLDTKSGNIRVETQMKSPNALNDMFNYKKHEILIDIIQSLISFVKTHIEDDKSNSKDMKGFNESVNVVKSVGKIETIHELRKEGYSQKQIEKKLGKKFHQLINPYFALRSMIIEELKLLRYYDIPEERDKFTNLSSSPPTT